MTDETKHQHEIENLIVGHFDGRLTEQEERELVNSLTTSAEAKRRFTSYMRMEGRLHSLGRDGFLHEPVAGAAVQPDTSQSQQSEEVTALKGRQSLSRSLTSSLSWIVSAAAVLALACWMLWPSSVSAASVLRQAQQAAAELVDRTYRVTLLDSEARQERELEINVGGQGRFVVRPVDNTYMLGSDGAEFWMTREGAPVWVTDDYHSLAPELRRRIPNRRILEVASSENEPLLLEMSKLLSLIERGYEIELVASPNAAEHHVRATRQRRRNGPAVIDVWADAESGVVLRANVEWSESRQNQFELVESEVKPDAWYRYSQHAPGRAVIRLDAIE